MKIKRILKWSVIVIVLALLVWFQIAYWTSTNDYDRQTAAPNHPMKAIVYSDYGLSNLKLENIEKPVPNDDQILVKVRAASINPYDWHFVEGTPYIMRMMGSGWPNQRTYKLVANLQGQVEASARKLTNSNQAEVFLAEEAGLF